MNKDYLACASCAARTVPPTGVYLGRPEIHRGRRICQPCGQFTINCTCRRQR